MSKIIADSHYDIGGYRDVYEDRVNARSVTTGGGLKLTLAAVADGVGGENKGERAAQTALDALVAYLEKSRESAIPVLLSQAVQFANKAVFQLQRETSGASTTLAVAAVDESTSRLYIANVGDSRIYLCRNQKLTQLTIDHSWATVMVWQGKVSADAARDHPRANVLMRALGAKQQIDVDLGFYVGTTDYEEANTRGLEGLPLQDGDAVLVCSDGLVKDSPKTGKALITTEEIVRTVNEKEGKKAAKELVSFALGRGPDDNISAALIQMPDRWRHWRAQRPMLIAGAIIFGLAIVLGLVIYALTGTQKKYETLAQKQAATSKMEQTRAAYTPTPTETPLPSETPTASSTPTITFTPSPTLLPFEPGQAGILRSQGNDTILKFGTPLSAVGQYIELFIFHKEEYKDTPGYVYALPDSLLGVRIADDQRFIMDVTSKTRLFVDTGGGYKRAEIQLANSSLNFSVEGSCLALDYRPDNQAVVSCYSGTCGYAVLGGSSGQIPTEKQVLFSSTNPTVTVSLTQTIPEAEAREWINLLPQGGRAFNCADKYVPTPTPTPTQPPTSTRTAAPRVTNTPNPPGNTPIIPTNTPIQPTNTSIQPTNTPKTPPTPTNTPITLPTPTNTPITPPTPTNTPKPPPTPTNTPKPPPTSTNTPITPPTPTNTPKPPPTSTNTPITPSTPTDTPKPPPTSTDTPGAPPLTLTNTLNIPAEEAHEWISLLPEDSSANNCANLYVPTPPPGPTQPPAPARMTALSYSNNPNPPGIKPIKLTKTPIPLQAPLHLGLLLTPKHQYPYSYKN